MAFLENNRNIKLYHGQMWASAPTVDNSSPSSMERINILAFTVYIFALWQQKRAANRSFSLSRHTEKVLTSPSNLIFPLSATIAPFLSARAYTVFCLSSITRLIASFCASVSA